MREWVAPAWTGSSLRRYPSRLHRGLRSRHRPLHLEFKQAERPRLRMTSLPGRGGDGVRGPLLQQSAPAPQRRVCSRCCVNACVTPGVRRMCRSTHRRACARPQDKPSKRQRGCPFAGTNGRAALPHLAPAVAVAPYCTGNRGRGLQAVSSHGLFIAAAIAHQTRKNNDLPNLGHCRRVRAPHTLEVCAG